MIAAPAVDVRAGRCVQLVGGEPGRERISLPDPVAVARRWRDEGFEALHVVDLDAALGEGSNRPLVRDLCSATGAAVQVGGGLRDEQAVRDVLDAGASRAIVGTRAIEDRDWLAALAERYEDRIVVAADIRDGVVLTRGWTRASDLGVEDFVDGLASLPLAGVLCTDVGREGRMAGIDEAAAARIVAASAHPVWISGGIRSMDELGTLERAGAWGVVLGMALYTETLPAAAVAGRYGRVPTARQSSSGESR